MLKNYFKAIRRSLAKDRQFSLLNLAGLSIALTCSVFIYLWVVDELRIDTFHANSSRLYQVMAHIKLPDGVHTQESTPCLLGRALVKEMPEIEDAVAFQQGYSKAVLTAGDKHIKARRDFADKDFFRMFSYPLIEGNKEHVLDDRYAVLLSDKLAKELFHTTQNAIGKTIHWADDPQLFHVTGVFQEPPANSSMKFELLFSYELFYQSNPDNQYWANSNPGTFLLLKPGTDINTLSNKLTNFLHVKYKDSPLHLSVQKYADRYLYNRYENGVQSGGRIRYVRIFSLIGVFILLIACINFMNLSTAKATGKLKEAGIKKILGAARSTLIFQYLGESMLMAFAALLAALSLVFVLLPSFNNLAGKQLSFHWDLSFILAVLSIGSLTGLLAGSYPALYLSGFKPVSALKSKLRTVWGELWMRKGLVVFQYTLSTLFIVAVMVIYQQMKLIQTIDLGYHKDNILSFKNEKTINDHFNAFMDDIKKISGVTAASGLNGDMYGGTSGSTEKANWEGNVSHTKILLTDLDIDYGLIEILGMKMKEGRSFSVKFASDSSGIILNEAAVHAMGIKNPVGKTFRVWEGDYHIIGVVQDFHFESLYEKVKPCFMRCHVAGGNILVKITAGREQEAIAKMSALYKTYNPGLPFEFSFLDKDYEAMYRSEETESILLRWFAAVAIIISCLGLFGLAAFSAQRRQKEMSIRKVVGASAIHIAGLLSKDFVKLVLVAAIISFPLSWWLMNLWLDNFAYRIHIGAGIFLITMVSILLIALITVSFQSIKAAVANPVKSLRGE